MVDPKELQKGYPMDYLTEYLMASMTEANLVDQMEYLTEYLMAPMTEYWKACPMELKKVLSMEYLKEYLKALKKNLVSLMAPMREYWKACPKEGRKVLLTKMAPKMETDLDKMTVWKKSLVRSKGSRLVSLTAKS